MKSAVITSNSSKTLQLLIDLAREMGLKSKVLTNEEIEDAGLTKAIRSGRTRKFIETEKFLKSLK